MLDLCTRPELFAAAPFLLAAAANASITGVSVTAVDMSAGYVLSDGSIAAGTTTSVGAAFATFDTTWDVYRLWATVDSALATVQNVGGHVDSNTDLILDPGLGGTFYNHPTFDSDGSQNPSLFGAFATAAFDTFITIGSANGSLTPLITEPNGEFSGFTGPVICQNCGWSTTPSPGFGVVPNPSGGFRILIGQFTVQAGRTFSGQVRLFGAGQFVVEQFDSSVVTSGAACCLPNGFCIEPVTPRDCTQFGGVFFNTACDSNNICPGACCFADSSCQEATEPGCNALGGAFQGAGVLCVDAGSDCFVGCCLSDGTCVDDVLADECLTQGGTPMGAGALCLNIECPSACCLPSGNCLDMILAADCLDLGGVHQAPGIICALANCEGSCCLPADFCIQPTSPDECTAFGGMFSYSPCTNNFCPGACCLEDGSCIDDLEVANCLILGGTPVPSAACSADTCDNLPPPCPWDCSPPPLGNDVINFDDLVGVVNAFSTQDLDCDVAPDNGDGSFGNGIITFDDVIAVINNFGDCPP